MKATLPGRWLAALACGAGVCCAAQAGAQPGDTSALDQPIPLALSCKDLNALLKAEDKRTGGVAILWLDGYYSGRSGLGELPAGWARTLSRGVAATCAANGNEQRTVLDVVGQLHREHGGKK